MYIFDHRANKSRNGAPKVDFPSATKSSQGEEPSAVTFVDHSDSSASTSIPPSPSSPEIPLSSLLVLGSTQVIPPARRYAKLPPRRRPHVDAELLGCVLSRVPPLNSAPSSC